MITPVAASPTPVIPLERILRAVSDLTRCRIFDALLNSEPLPASELSKRLGFPRVNISKHVAYLLSVGLLRRGYGNLYSIPACFLVPGQRALDFGAVLLRLDRLNAK